VCLDNIGQVREGLVHRTPKTYDYEETTTGQKEVHLSVKEEKEVNIIFL